MAIRPIHEMRPREILAARDASGCAFVPVSPVYEWHSYHLPMGTDAVIAEEVSRLLAERIDGVYFPTLSLALDQFRTTDQLKHWGLPHDAKVFGMNFPALPLVSEYTERDDLIRVLSNRLAAIRGSGFRHTFVINIHADPGQMKTLREFCEQANGPDHGVHFIYPLSFKTIRNPDLLWIGGHAGLYETMVVLAFRPELVDLDELPEGELSVAEYGIHHGTPMIEPRYNPRRAVQSVADDLRKDILDHVESFVREKAGL